MKKKEYPPKDILAALLVLEDQGFVYSRAAKVLRDKGWTVTDKTLKVWHGQYASLLETSNPTIINHAVVEKCREEVVRQCGDVVAEAASGLKSVVKRLNQLLDEEMLHDPEKLKNMSPELLAFFKKGELKVKDLISIGDFLAGVAGFKKKDDDNENPIQQGNSIYNQIINGTPNSKPLA